MSTDTEAPIPVDALSIATACAWDLFHESRLDGVWGELKIESVPGVADLGELWLNENGLYETPNDINQLTTWLGRQAGTMPGSPLVGPGVITGKNISEVPGTTVRYLNRVVGVYGFDGQLLPDTWNGWGDGAPGEVSA